MEKVNKLFLLQDGESTKAVCTKAIDLECDDGYEAGELVLVTRFIGDIFIVSKIGKKNNYSTFYIDKLDLPEFIQL